MDSNAKLDATLLRQPGVAFGHAVLNFERAANGIDDAAKFNNDSVADALDDAAAVHVDRWIEQIAAQRAQTSERPILVLVSQSAVANDVCGQYRCQFSWPRHARSCNQPCYCAKALPLRQTGGFIPAGVRQSTAAQMHRDGLVRIEAWFAVFPKEAESAVRT